MVNDERAKPTMFERFFGAAARLVQTPTQSTTELWPILTPAQLLSSPKRIELLKQIRRLTSVTQRHWDLLYESMFRSYAALVQELPASEVHHHAYRGGLLDHGLEVVLSGLKLRRGYVLPIGAAPERIGEVAELYTFAVASACLVHDIGKLACDQHIEVFDQASSRVWLPFEGAMRGQHYAMRYVRGRRHRLHEPLSLMLATLIVPLRGIEWLAGDIDVWSAWVLALAGQCGGADVIDEIVRKADGSSVAGDLGAGDNYILKTETSGARPLHQKILVALRHLLHDGKLSINRKGAAGWLTQDGLWLVSKTTVDAIRAQLIGEGHQGIPTQNIRVFDILQEHGVLRPNGERAIWRCRVDDGAGWSHELTLLLFSPSLIWEQDEGQDRWNGTVTPLSESQIDESDCSPPTDNHKENAALAQSANEPQKPEEVVKAAVDVSTCNVTDEKEQSEDDLGAEFLTWLRRGLASNLINVNEPDAQVHVIDEGVFLVTPAIFRRFATENYPEIIGGMDCDEKLSADNLLTRVRSFKPATAKSKKKRELWQVVQSSFQKLRLHEKNLLKDENIWTCKVQGPRRAGYIKGFLIKDKMTILSQDYTANEYLTLKS
jgi:integrating conjugative element relaxase (TIGR03760 family)